MQYSITSQPDGKYHNTLTNKSAKKVYIPDLAEKLKN